MKDQSASHCASLAREIEEKAAIAFNLDDYVQLLSLSRQLMAIGGEEKPLALWYEGLALENMRDYPGSLELARSSYEEASTLAPSLPTFQALARVCIKLGPARMHEARLALESAQMLGGSPEIDLGLGEMYRSLPKPDYVTAGRHFVKAALKGREAGFHCWINSLKCRERHLQAALVSIFFVLVRYPMRLFLGDRTRYIF